MLRVQLNFVSNRLCTAYGGVGRCVSRCNNVYFLPALMRLQPVLPNAHFGNEGYIIG